MLSLSVDKVSQDYTQDYHRLVVIDTVLNSHQRIVRISLQVQVG